MEIIKLNLIPNGVNPTCHAKQYDEGRVIRFELFDGLTPYTLQSGDTVTLNLRKPDNTIIESSVTATQGNKYVDLVTTEQMCACAGYNLGTFKIVNGSVDIGTLNFIMEVGKDVLANGIPSQSVIEDLDALVAEAVGDNYYTKTETDNKLALKANAADVYIKTDIDNTLDEFTELVVDPDTDKEYQEITAVSNHLDNRIIYNSQYNRVAQSGTTQYFGYNVYSVTAGKYRIYGYGYDTVAGVLAVVGNANIVESGASYCNLLQVINTGDTTNYTWHTVEVEIEQDGYLYVNYETSGNPKVEKVIEAEIRAVITDGLLTDPILPANAKAVGDALKRNGIIKNGSEYTHFSYSHNNKYILRTIGQLGINNLYDYKKLALGHFENGAIVIDSTFWTAFTDQIGPVSMRLHGDTGYNQWTGGVHSKTIDGTNYPTAEVQSINVYVDGVDITNSQDGIYYGDCRIIAVNKLYAPQTISGADLTTATLAFLETRTFILTDTLKVQVKLEFMQDIDVGLYYGMQGQDNHADYILLPTACEELERTSLSSGVLTNSKEWNIMLSDANHWHFDMILSNYGVGDWIKNDGTSSYGRISHYDTTKIYYVLCSGGTFNTGVVFFWEGEYKTYHD